MDTVTGNAISRAGYHLQEPDQPTTIALKEFSTFFLTKTTLSEFRSEKELDFLRPGLYGIQRVKGSTSFKQIAKIEGLILIPGREVTQREKSLKGITSKVTDRRYVLLTFHPFKDATLRQRANRLAWRTPLIPIRPGLLISPHTRASRFRAYEKILLRPSEYIRRIVDLGKTVWYAPKLKLLQINQEHLIEKWIQETFEERAAFILNRCNTLLQESKANSTQSHSNKQVNQKLSLLRKRLQQIRAQSFYFEREVGFDHSPIVHRVAAKVSRVRHKLMNT